MYLSSSYKTNFPRDTLLCKINNERTLTMQSVIVCLMFHLLWCGTIGLSLSLCSGGDCPSHPPTTNLHSGPVPMQRQHVYPIGPEMWRNSRLRWQFGRVPLSVWSVDKNLNSLGHDWQNCNLVMLSSFWILLMEAKWNWCLEKYAWLNFFKKSSFFNPFIWGQINWCLNKYAWWNYFKQSSISILLMEAKWIDV